MDLDTAGAHNETQLIHRMRQGLRSEIRAALYRNPTIPKDLPTFLEAVARAESSIHLEHKSSSHAGKSSTHNREKPVDKATENSHSSNNHNNHKSTNTRGNSQAQFRGRGGREGRSSRGGHRRGKASNGTPASIGHWSNECPDLAPKN